MSDVVIGARLQLDANDGIKSLKQVKAEITAAKGELIAMAEKFGATSEQARNAAKRVAELQDNISDAKQLVDAFNPDKKFIALTQSLNGALGGFTALTGAMGLLGVESEEVQKQLLKVQSALALSQGLNQIGDSIASFKTLGKTLVDTFGKGGLMGIAIAGLAALSAAFLGLFNRNKLMIEATKEYAKASLDAKKEVRYLQQNIDLAKKGVISKKEALEKFNSTIGQTVGHAKDLNHAEKLLKDNASEYVRVQGLKAKANFLLAESAKLSGQAELLRIELEGNSAKGLAGKALDKFLSNAEDKSRKIEERVAKINEQIAESSKGFNVTGGVGAGVGGAGGSFTPKTPGGKAKLEEIEESKYLENMLMQWEAEKALKEKELKNIHSQELQAIDVSKFENSAILQQLQTTMEQNEADARVKIAEDEADAKIEAAKAVGSALGALSELIGKQTAAGKALAIAQATINTWVGVTEVLRAKSVLPEPFSTIAKIANVATIIASGLIAIKNIVKTPVPGGGGSAPSTSALSPLQPQAQNTNTLLNQQQLNQIGNATTRAFVVESDIQNNRDRVTRLNRAARI